MANPKLEGARAKVEWAKKHIRDLDAERVAFLGSHPYTVNPKFYPEHGATCYLLDKYTPIPASIPLLAGDAVHSIRTALDYLVYALVERNPGDPVGAHLYFPICKSAKAYKAESPGKTNGVPIPIKERIDALKPYDGGDNRLWELHQLDIIDKHRLLMTTATVIRDIEFDVDAGFIEGAFPGLMTMPLDFSKQTLKFPAPEPLFPMEEGALLYGVIGNFETDRRINLTFDIALGEAWIFKGNLLVKTLTELSDLVESIVLSFDT